MSATALVQARIDPELKKAVEVELNSWGLDITTAIRMFFAKIYQEHALPFRVGDNKQYMDAADYDFARQVEQIEQHIANQDNIIDFDDNDAALKYLQGLV